MNISEICINRPVFTIVLSLIIVALGGVFFTKLQVRDIPNINPPIITISAQYDGADALYMEKQITQRIEDAVKIVNNLEDIKSSSSNGTSQVILTFKLNADIEIALNDVRSLISGINHKFPDDMSLPSVAKLDSDARPSFWLSINSDRHDYLELTQIADNQIKSVLEKLPMIGQATIYGARYYTMRIEPINHKMYQHQITPIDLEQALLVQNKDYPAGSIKTDVRDFSLKLTATLNTVKGFQNIILKKSSDGQLIKISDVAYVSLEPYENDIIMRYDGTNSLAIGLVKQSDANLIDLSKSVYKELKKIQTTLPPGVNVNVAYDAAIPVNASINSVYHTIFEAIILVSIVTYIFLGSIRITIIPLLAIPISLIGTFSVMYALGFSINTFTLLAMILAIGLVVDDAIVMLENIFRHNKELEKKPFQAAIDASKEIGFAVVAMTITLAAVFLPIGLMEGFLGKLFIEFAWALAFCILFSGFIALTLTPMVTSRLINDHSKKKIYILQLFDKQLEKLQTTYTRCLEIVLNNKIKFYLVCLISVGILVFSFLHVDKIFVPEEDEGYLQVFFNGVEGSSIEQSLITVKKAEKIMSTIPEIDSYLDIIGFGGSEKAIAFVPLKNWSKRSRSQAEIQKELNIKFSALPSMSIFAIGPPAIGVDEDKPISFYLETSLEYDALDIISQNFMKDMEKHKVFSNIERDYYPSTPTLDIIVDREKAYRYDVGIDTIGRTVQYLIAGKKAGDFRIGNDIYDVMIRYDLKDRSSPLDIQYIQVRNNNNIMLPIETVAKINETTTVKTYHHYNTSKAIKITANLTNGYTISEAANTVQKIANELLNLNNTHISFTGEIEQMNKSGNETIIIFGFALLFIFLVLSAQFESFVDSTLILISVPFSMTGGVLALYLFGNSINMYSNIGLITLIGLITKNAIMLVEFTNQLRARGKTVREALIEAAKLRLRPILMTTIATVCGAIPLLFASGAGAASRHSIGIVIVGGMLVGTLFTLFVIPLVYQAFKRETIVQKKS